MFCRYFPILAILALICTACSALPAQGAADQPSNTSGHAASGTDFVQWDVPHTHLTMLLPSGWVSEYHQGTITIASRSNNLFYSPSEPFEGVLINMFVSDGPRAVGPTFDVLKLAEDYVSDQENIAQRPALVESDGRQIVTTLYLNKDTKGKLITYLAGFVVEEQQLTVFLAATPTDTQLIFLPILIRMLESIQIRSSL